MAKTKARGQVLGASTYGNDPVTGYRDAGDNNRPASGIPNKYPAVAIGLNAKNLRKFVEITPSTGRYRNQTLLVRVGDLGPSIPGRVDENAVLARLQGLPQGGRFPTGSKTTVGRLYDKPPAGAQKITTGLYALGGAAPKVGKANAGKAKAAPTGGLASQIAQRSGALDTSQLGAASAPDIQLQSDVLPQVSASGPALPSYAARARVPAGFQAPSAGAPQAPQGGLADQLAALKSQTDATPFAGPQQSQDVNVGTVSPTTTVPKPKALKGAAAGEGEAKAPAAKLKQAIKQGRSPAAAGFKPGGVVKPSWSGKPLAAWIASELEVARKLGWQGQVNSGYRSDAEQAVIYRSGVRPAAVPKSMGGQGSRHSGKNYPLGAVDVSEAPQLARILARMGSPLKYAGSKDPVHFSVPINGSY